MLLFTVPQKSDKGGLDFAEIPVVGRVEAPRPGVKTAANIGGYFRGGRGPLWMTCGKLSQGV